MAHRRVLILLLAKDFPVFPVGFSSILAGLYLGKPQGVPSTWTELHYGRIGIPHGFLFPQERLLDTSQARGPLYLPPPLAHETEAYRGMEVLTYMEESSEGPVLEGVKDGLFFRIPALDLEPYRKKRLLPGTPPGPTRVQLPQKPLCALVVQLGNELATWDPELFRGLDFVDWKSWKPERKEPRTLYSFALPLAPSLKAESIALGHHRADPKERFHGLSEPPLGFEPFPMHEEVGPLTLGGVFPRVLTSSMQGETRIAGGKISVTFFKGRLTHLPWGSTERETLGPVRSYVSFEGKTVGFVAISSFAIEDEGQWGIRETLLAESPHFRHPGHMVCDYFFTEGGHELTVSLSVRWPVFRFPVIVQAWAPLELPVARLRWGATPALNGWFEGTWFPLPLQSGIQRLLAVRASHGTRGLTLRFYQQLGHRPHDLPFSVRKGRLWFNPEGGYTEIRSKDWEGREEHHNWGLAVDTEPFEAWAAEPTRYLLPPKSS